MSRGPLTGFHLAAEEHCTYSSCSEELGLKAKSIRIIIDVRYDRKLRAKP